MFRAKFRVVEWCFYRGFCVFTMVKRGQVVVECVVKLVFGLSLFPELKIGTFFQLNFRAAAGLPLE